MQLIKFDKSIGTYLPLAIAETPCGAIYAEFIGHEKHPLKGFLYYTEEGWLFVPSNSEQARREHNHDPEGFLIQRPDVLDYLNNSMIDKILLE